VKISPLFLALVTCSMLAGCSTFNDVHFDHQASSQFTDVAGTSFDVKSPSAPTSLLLMLPNDEVKRLVATALTHNPNLQQSLLSVKSAQQQLIGTSSSQWPSLTAELGTSKLEGSTTSYSPSLDISWTADIWQQLANSSSAQQANVLATEYAYQGARDILAAQVMQGYLGLIQTSQLTKIESQRVAAYQTNEHIIVDRYRKGLTDLKELDSAKSSTQSSQATLVSYQAELQQAIRNLSLLTGLTKNSVTAGNTFPAVSKPMTLLTDQDLSRRPDLQQAYQDIVASQFEHKVAYKSLLPSLSLSGSISNVGTNLHDTLFGSSAWQLLGRLSAPLFNAGRLKSEVEIAKFSAEKSYWGFQSILLNAVNEVQNAHAQEQSLSQQLTLTQAALQSAQRSEVTYTSRYRLGTVSLLDLLQVQQQTFSLQTQITQLTYQRLSNRISLGLALGLGV